MISFDLRCAGDHVFEAWFRSSADHAAQAAGGLIVCPICGSEDVAKAVMAPNVGAKGNALVPRRPVAEPAAASPPVMAAGAPAMPPAMQAAWAMVAAAQAASLPRSRWVGAKFAEEARAIHESDIGGETIIHGQATREEAEALAEDGIAVMPLLVPFVPPEARN